jgi:iron(III) transport system permease protein
MLVVRTDIPGKSWLRMLLLLPYGIPPFIGAMAWAQLFGPVGYVSKLYMTPYGRDVGSVEHIQCCGVVLVLAGHISVSRRVHHCERSAWHESTPA